jgi:hypothetical protein
VLTGREIAAGAYGAWRLALFDPAGMQWFDRSIEGFWRSFRVAALVAPAYALLLYLHDLSGSPPPDLARYLVVQAIAYVVMWVAFPLVMAHLAPIIDRDAEYLGFVVAYNWSTILQMAVLLPLAFLLAGRTEPGGPASLLALAGQLALLVYEWFIVKTALRLGGFAATGLVLLDFVLSLLIGSVTDHLAVYGGAF